MKKRPILAGILLFVLSFNLVLTCPLTGKAEENISEVDYKVDERKSENSTTNELYAQAAVLMDAANGRILLEKNGDQILPMASTTKIMTCILVLEEADIEEIIPVSSYAASMPKVHIGVKKGEYYKIKDLLYSLMLESHNDSAVILAEYIGSKKLGMSMQCQEHSREESQKAVLAFSEMMNQKAKELGCENTCFITPNGLDATISGNGVEKVHSTTASELAKVMSYCAFFSEKKEEFLDITRAESYSFTNYKATEDGSYEKGSRSISCTNHNAFLTMMDGALTGKTGFTNKAGYCYVGALEQNDKKYTIALLACGWPNHKTWKWHDSRILYEYGLKEYNPANIFCEAKLEEIPVLNGIQDSVSLKMEEKDIELLLSQKDEVKVELELEKELEAPVKEDSLVGYQKYYVNGILYEKVSIFTDESVNKFTYNYCLERILKWFLL